MGYMEYFEVFEDNLRGFSNDVIIAEQKEKDINDEIFAIEATIKGIEDKNAVLAKSIEVFNHASSVSRETAKNHFEQIVTNALQFVTQSTDYEFVIQELTSRSKPSYEFYVKSTVNGIECLQKPEDANGGGFVDIISVALKYAYLEVFNDPKIMSATLFYDEPGKMISDNMSVKFAEYLKFLGTQYGRQTIMITHNENIANIADTTFNVKKDLNGISIVEQYDSINFDQFIKDLKNL